MVNVVLNTIGRVLNGDGTTGRRHSTAVTDGSALSASTSSWILSPKTKRCHGSSSNISSYALLEPKNIGTGRRGSTSTCLLTVPNSSGHIPDQQVSRNRYESGGGSKSRSRSRSGGGGKGQRPRRKQSLASTIFNMIINPAPTSRSHHQRIGFSQRQQRSFDIISSSSSSSVQQQQQHQLQLSPPDSGNNSLVSLATTERQCKHQYQMRQQHSYAGETEEVMVLTETERSSSRDGEPSSYCFLGGGRRMQKKHSASRPAADKLAPVAQTDSTRRRGLPRWMKSEEIVEYVHEPDYLNQPLRSMNSLTMHKPAPKTVLFGFCKGEQSSNKKVSSVASLHANDEFKATLGDCSKILRGEGFEQGLLLRCIDQQKPLHSYMHYAIFKSEPPTVAVSRSRSQSPSSSPPPPPGIAEPVSTTNIFWNKVLDDLCPQQQQEQSNTSDFGTYKIIDTMLKATTDEATETQSLAQTPHSGYIVICFKLLDNTKQQSLEKSWLLWTGASEIYKHTPASWNLRRITIHRQCLAANRSGICSFAYILVCEFGNILHPSNKLAAFDMCERLRARKCGDIALYQVQKHYSPNLMPSTELGRRASPNSTSSRRSYGLPRQHSHRQPLQSSTTNSPTLRKNHHNHHHHPTTDTPYSSPKLPGGGISAAQRRKIMDRGYSYDVDSAGFHRAKLDPVQDRSFVCSEPEEDDGQQQQTVMTSEEYRLMSQFGAQSLNNNNNNNINNNLYNNRGEEEPQRMMTPPSNRYQTPPPMHHSHHPSLPPCSTSYGHYHQFHHELSNV